MKNEENWEGVVRWVHPETGIEQKLRAAPRGNQVLTAHHIGERVSYQIFPATNADAHAENIKEAGRRATSGE
jgi:hypothetical protein